MSLGLGSHTHMYADDLLISQENKFLFQHRGDIPSSMQKVKIEKPKKNKKEELENSRDLFNLYGGNLTEAQNKYNNAVDDVDDVEDPDDLEDLAPYKNLGSVQKLTELVSMNEASYLEHFRNTDETVAPLVEEFNSYMEDPKLCVSQENVDMIQDFFKKVGLDVNDDQAAEFIYSDKGKAELKEKFDTAIKEKANEDREHAITEAKENVKKELGEKIVKPAQDEYNQAAENLKKAKEEYEEALNNATEDQALKEKALEDAEKAAEKAADALEEAQDRFEDLSDDLDDMDFNDEEEVRELLSQEDLKNLDSVKELQKAIEKDYTKEPEIKELTDKMEGFMNDPELCVSQSSVDMIQDFFNGVGLELDDKQAAAFIFSDTQKSEVKTKFNQIIEAKAKEAKSEAVKEAKEDVKVELKEKMVTPIEKRSAKKEEERKLREEELNLANEELEKLE